jgi:hypothetical protein
MPTHSRRALARLAFSAAAAQLADHARGRVPTYDDSGLRPGELLDEARSLVVAAQELLEKAIVFERERGTSWAELGEVLGVSKQAAQQQHGQAVDDWTVSVNLALTVADGGVVFAHVPGEGGDTPAELAERLDAWCAQYAGKHNRPRGTNPVTEGLELAGSAEQVVLLNRLAQRMTNEQDPAKQRAFHTAKAVLMASLAEETPEDVEAQRAAARSQRELDTLKPNEKKANVLFIAEARKKSDPDPKRKRRVYEAPDGRRVEIVAASATEGAKRARKLLGLHVLPTLVD